MCGILPTMPAQEVVDLFYEGYSAPAIASILGISESRVSHALSESGVHCRPDGYSTIAEEARRFHIPTRFIEDAMDLGDIKYITHRGQRYLKREWTDNWVVNSRYRKHSRKVSDRVFLALSKHQKPSPSGQ